MSLQLQGLRGCGLCHGAVLGDGALLLGQGALLLLLLLGQGALLLLLLGQGAVLLRQGALLLRAGGRGRAVQLCIMGSWRLKSCHRAAFNNRQR